jgi:cardiolipin synthase (CMP-forming)
LPVPSLLSQLSTPPNILTVSRMLLTPYLSFTLLHPPATPSFAHYATVAGLCFYLPASDYMDGYLARRYDMATPMGSFLDPFADKFLLATLSLSLLATPSLLPSSDVLALVYPEVIALWLARDIGLLGMGYVVMGGSGFSKIFTDGGASGASSIQPSIVSKGNTVLQMGTLSMAIVYLGLGDVMAESALNGMKMVIEGSAICSVFTTVGSAVGYVDGSSLKSVKK